MKMPPNFQLPLSSTFTQNALRASENVFTWFGKLLSILGLAVNKRHCAEPNKLSALHAENARLTSLYQLALKEIDTSARLNPSDDDIGEYVEDRVRARTAQLLAKTRPTAPDQVL